MKFASLFTGGDGVGIAAHQAMGFELAWGIELVDWIADTANRNLGNHVITANVLDCDPHDFEPVDFLHASPPCPNFSNAKTGGEETEDDKRLARKVAEFVQVLQPRFFTLENVLQYRKSQSWQIIYDALEGLGYFVYSDNVNSADYGVPQTRRRFIVRAAKTFLPPMPRPQRWVSWYEAIGDLIPGLPDSQLAPWQVRALEKSKTVIFDAAGPHKNRRSDPYRDIDQPGLTVTTGQSGATLLVDANNTHMPGARITRNEHEPSMTIAGNNKPNRLLIDSNNASVDGRASIRDGGQPTITVSAGRSSAQPVLLIDGHNSHTASGARIYKAGDEPAMSATADPHPNKIFDGYICKRTTPRCLARFQTIPDWYDFGDLSATRQIKIIGNAVPPKLMEAVFGTMDPQNSRPGAS